jgi:hypothetical protein
MRYIKTLSELFFAGFPLALTRKAPITCASAQSPVQVAFFAPREENKSLSVQPKFG